MEYQDGQGLFKCAFCGSVYESDMTQDGQASVKVIHLIEKKLNNIENHTEQSAGIATEERLQKKAGQIQDKIDYKYIEFANGLAQKLGSGAFVLWIVGAILIMCGLGDSPFSLVIVGLLVIGAGVGLFMLFKKKKAAYEAEVEAIRTNELEPVYDQLRKKGAVLDGGAVAVGYTESTSVPLRYCVSCHKNITPAKASGASFAGLSGANLMLTVFTCGAWLPAWIFIEILSKAGGMARRATKSGACPQCGSTTLFPARVPNA